MNTISDSFVQSDMNSNQRIVAGYVLQQKLGSGSFAVVYKGVKAPLAEPNALPDTVAIKAISRDSQKITKKVLQNLEIEISILRTYRHRNIVCLHDVQKTERHFYLILEYCGGGDVQHLIRTRKTGRLSERLTRRLMRDLAAGLKFLWGQELIHRDIKPQNLLLTGPLPIDEVNDSEQSDDMEQIRQQTNFPSDQFALKIADFGFARELQTASLAETLCGSPLYMAPEILQHHRYDAKADLWSVGTVLFEMISGKPPFHGENHIDLLRNIQRKAVRLPPDVKVSKECVNLLRLLLNRNPLSRAGFKEFFQASDAFVALGCEGNHVMDQGTCRVPAIDLETIPENERTVPGEESLLTVASHPGNQNAQRMTNTGASPAMGVPVTNTVVRASNAQVGVLTPLVPSPPTSSPSPIAAFHSASQRQLDNKPSNTTGNNVEASQSRRNDGTQSSDSFVMVEHGSSYPITKSPAESTTEYFRQDPRSSRDTPPPSSPRFFFGSSKSPVLNSSRGDYMVVKKPKGMLSTSPGTGGALMGMLSGRARLLYDGVSAGKQIEPQLKSSIKMLATVEDIGRRAISVANLGDSRAYAAMRLIMGEGASSSVLSVTPMDGIVEETQENDSGTVTDDSSSTEIMASTRRRRSSSATDKSMHDAKVEEVEEMPFALHIDPTPLVATGMPSRESSSFSKGTSITSAKSTIKPTAATIKSYFKEALSCYLKALKMLKGSLTAAQGAARELELLLSQRLTTEQRAAAEKTHGRTQITLEWLAGQFKGVLERADASNAEISKLSVSEVSSEKNQTQKETSAEELIYNYALAYGREGAVKQLLGQYEAARASYRSAGLLAETLLMESILDGDDRKVLEDYVDGFAARITELDVVIPQQSRMSSAMSSATSSRRGQGVVGLVQPYPSPSITLGSPPM